MRKREKLSSVGLLPRMEARPWKDGKTVSYRYKPNGGGNINLGTDKQKAILKVAQMGGSDSKPGSINDLWLMYQTSSYWAVLGDRTKDDYTAYSKHLLRVFGKIHAAAIRPTHLARYLRTERSSAPVRANREIALLSNLMNLAIEQGLIDRNPCKEVKRNKETPRDVSPEVELLAGFIQWLYSQSPQRKIMAMAAEYASLAGNRQIEFLKLEWAHIDEVNGIITTRRAKQHGGKKVNEAISISLKMHDLLSRIKEINRDCIYVFPNRKNNAYTGSGFRSMWQRCIVEAIAKGVIPKDQRFAFHDLRAYYVTQHKNDSGVLPEMHANPATTAKTYDRSKQSKRSSL